MTVTVAVRHNFETAHRLPALGGKCVNLHGHSWGCTVEVTGTPDNDGVLLDFATLKRWLRDWVDSHLDHGTMLGHQDPLTSLLLARDLKVFVFGTGLAHGLGWPTVENVAHLLGRVTGNILTDLDPHQRRQLSVARVTVTETATNQATWTPAGEERR